MSFPISADCLNEVFENLEDDKITLHSCLLVSRLWCKISVRILWRDIWNFKYSVAYNRRSEVTSAILNTLISCLPDKSKELLHKNEIIFSTLLNKPLFNYTAFCKVLSINEISQAIHEVLKSQPFINSQNLKDGHCLVLKELLKMFMNQVSSLKTLTYYMNTFNLNVSDDISLIRYSGAKDCLTNLSELCCNTKVHSKFFYELSQICHNLRSLTIIFESKVSNELKELVSSQNNLKTLKLSNKGNDWTDIIPALTKHSNTLTKLLLYNNGSIDKLPLLFVSSFLNLQEIKFSFVYQTEFEKFKELQYVTFPKLQILKIPLGCPKPEYLMKFLEINGKYLKELYIFENDKSLNLFIAKFCPNLRKLFILIYHDDLNILKTIFSSCQYLEGIVIWSEALSEKEILEVVANHSPKNFYELKIRRPKLFLEDLESFFISWKKQTSKKSLSLILANVKYFDSLKVNMKIIEKYKNLGVVKKFETRDYDEQGIYL